MKGARAATAASFSLLSFLHNQSSFTGILSWPWWFGPLSYLQLAAVDLGNKATATVPLIVQVLRNNSSQG